jgi:hypothetical protein
MAAGAAVACAGGTLQAGTPTFQGYETDASGWDHPNGSNVTRVPTGTNYGGDPIQSLSGSYFGLMQGGTEIFTYGTSIGQSGDRTTFGGKSSWASTVGTVGDNPSQKYFTQNFVYLSNNLGDASPNNTNVLFYHQVTVAEDFGGGNFSINDPGFASFRVRRTAGDEAAGKFGLSALTSGSNNIAPITVDGDAWYGFFNVYSVTNDGYGQLDTKILDATGAVLGSTSVVFNGSVGAGSSSVELGIPGPPTFAGFGQLFVNYIDPPFSGSGDRAGIAEFGGIPMDNSALGWGDQPIIPPHVPIPEPASLLLLGAGSALLLRRRDIQS